MTIVSRFSLATLLAAIAVQTLSAQPQGFYDVHSADGDVVWAVGNGGRVFRSVDGGATWAQFVLGSSALRAVHSLGATVWVAGDSGKLYRTTNFGDTWQSLSLASPTTKFTDIQFLNAQTGFLVGSNGAMFKTTNGGATWDSKTPASPEQFNALSFRDNQVGFVVAKNGKMQRTTDGGESWTDISNPLWTGKEIFSVSAKGDVVYVVGEDGLAFKSLDGGNNWVELNFKTDSRSDVTGVYAQSADSVFFIGGGGFIRRTTNRDQSYIWGQHEMHAPLSRVYFFNHLKGWAVSERNNAVLRTTDGGATWQLPTGTTINASWIQTRSGSFIGNTLVHSPFDKRTIYAAGSGAVIRSTDLGETWTQIATIPNATQIHSFYVSHRDSNTWIAAVSRQRVVKTTNAGQTWTTTITATYTNYGMPLEMSPDNPEIVYYAPEAQGNPQNANARLYRSTDFGSTWDTVAVTQFRSPCDLQIVRGDSANVMWCADGITGSGQSRLWRSTDEGRTWTNVYTGTGSEMPMLANGIHNPALGFVTQWSSGGVQRTTDYGRTWTTISTVGSAWGVDIARDDPNVMVFGVYGGGNSYLSLNRGDAFRQIPLTGSNSGFLFIDRATLLALQTSRIAKLSVSYAVPTSNAQTLALSSPAPNAIVNFGANQNIVWTATNIPRVKIEFQPHADSAWRLIADNVPGSLGSFAWSVPPIPTSSARVRVSDNLDGDPVATSGAFTIRVALMSLSRDSLALVVSNAPVSDTIRLFNNGNGTLVVSDVQTSLPNLRLSRRTFSIPPQSSDTIAITALPFVAGSYRDTLRIVSNAPSSPELVKVGVQVLLSSSRERMAERAQTFELEQNYPNPFNPSTVIRYRIPTASFVTLKVYDVLGREIATLVSERQSAGQHSVTFDASNLVSGTYFYRLSAGEFASVKKMLFVK
ncbi:MAG: YCF48-related protein [Chloroherpetonaceae bacterium]|nr:YCF48-related protein [Chloroherpetonaceae bacterium]